MSMVQAVAIAAVTLPALAFALWPLARRRGESAGARGIAPGDRRLELEEEKVLIYRALRELAFDHEAGHLTDDDYESLRARYEQRGGLVLAELDTLVPPVAPAAEPAAQDVPTRGWTKHPATIGVGAVLLIAFGILLGINAGRFTEPVQGTMPPGGAGPEAAAPAPGAGMPPAGPASEQSRGAMPPVAGIEPGKPIPPEILGGMLRAARQSLRDGRYSEAIAAYQAVLKRDPKNVDALTHLGLIVAIGGHADAALETFDKALALDPQYAPALLYRGQVLYDVKQDYPGAIQSWDRYLALVPQGEERDRVAALVKDARAKQPAR